MAILTGTLQQDNINGTIEADQVLALSGDDRVIGGGGADVIDGGDGNDTLYAAGAGFWRDGVLDAVTGGIGDDQVYGAYGDILDGGIGFDRLALDVSGADEGVSLDFRRMTLGVDLGLGGLAQVDIPLADGRLGGFEAVDRLIGSSFNDLFRLANADSSGSRVDAGAGDDFVRSGRGGDQLFGGDGSDMLNSAGGDDALDGGAGDDRLLGGHGRDVLTGGDGADRFTFRTRETGAGRANADEITDFSQADGDKIVLARIDAIAGTDRNDHFTFIGHGQFSGAAGELRFINVGDATFVMGDIDGDAKADLMIRIDGTVELTKSDFIL